MKFPEPPIARSVISCRFCDGALDSVLDFGEPYISDFLEPGQEGIRAPLHVMACRRCGLAQLQHTIRPDVLWGDRYWYKSGTNERMVADLRDIAQMGGPLAPGDRVLDIGANDGTLLSFYPDYVEKVAVDPIASFKGELAARADVVVRDFWPTEIDGNFKRITSIACFYDADDPHDWVEAIRDRLTDDGLWIVQFQDTESIVRQNAFDYWCHEHTILWGARQFEALVAQHGMHIESAVANDVNGGSLRFVVGKGQGTRWVYGPEANRKTWQKFAKRACRLKNAAWEELEKLDAAGYYALIGLAASTKANTLLQWYGLNAAHIWFIVERAPEKIGKETVGSRIPIVAEDDPRARADYYIPLAWHYSDGLRQRHPDTPFLTFLPEVRTYAPVLVLSGSA